MRIHSLSLLIAFAVAGISRAETVIVEAEAFQDIGGWVVDQQFMDQMGSPYLLAHGLGEPVKDATTTAAFNAPGQYHLWVRTKDWVAPWNAKGAPGKFQVLIDGQAVPVTFGTEGAQWHWQDGGTVRVAGRQVKLALHDLTGFEGRWFADCTGDGAVGFLAGADFDVTRKQHMGRAISGTPGIPARRNCFRVARGRWI
jgi:hypothetical protein